MTEERSHGRVPVDGLVAALDLEELGPDRYRAQHVLANGLGVVFGGQLLAQSVAAALLGNEDKRVKTLHTIFARGASPDAPLEVVVDRMHAGRAFASSTVTISQGDRLCTRSLVLLTADEDDFIQHADPAPGLAPPADADDDGAWEVRVVDDVDVSDPDQTGPPDLDVWVRFPGAPDDPGVDQALLAFASDGFLIGTAMRPHAGVGIAQAHVTVTTGVVSHTLTFHERFAARDWLLLSHHSPHAGHGRSYGRADVFTPGGALVASYVQDGMIRPKNPDSKGPL
ncbi:MAG TPA: acyl-CoA thioesterase domain-containing protein [Acidimicrobiales bacterium]|nr:acyl-CoA thioesterase domain-containing protein [Acidimicrobiales bacterium]